MPKVNFFTNMLVRKQTKIGITSLLSDITTKPDSHKGGWARLLRCQLVNAGFKNVYQLRPGNHLSQFDAVIFDMGAEYSGSLNLFGGLDQLVLDRLEEIEAFDGQIYSWHHPLPMLQESMRGREDVKSTCPRAKKAIKRGLLKDVDRVLDRCEVFDHVEPLTSLFVCDSHGPAVWTPRYMIHRTDGLTLHRLLKSNLLDVYLRELNRDVTELMVHVSSIDVRHHLCRLPDPVESTIALADFLCTTLDKLPFRIAVVDTMGIEDESRKLPKTGYYKGTPFYGSWSERNHIRNVFNSRLTEYQGLHFEILHYPQTFFEPLRGSLRFDVMEKPQSIHISPSYYRWDLDENRSRWEY